MTDTLLGLVGSWGASALMVVTFLSCLALPLPSSLMMITAGAFAASGDMDLTQAALGAYAGAVAGDQAGYLLGGRLAGLSGAQGHPARAALIARARATMDRWGMLAVFFTRWMFAALGPYVNFVAGGAGMGWRRFTLGSVSGEAVWVGAYVGLGYALSDRITQLADMLGSASGFLTSAAITGALGWVVWKRR